LAETATYVIVDVDDVSEFKSNLQGSFRLSVNNKQYKHVATPLHNIDMLTYYRPSS